MNETVGIVFIVVGLLFDLLGAIGLVRLPDIYNRLQAATKCVTLGTCAILVGILIYRGFDPLGTKALLCAVFIILTSPTGAHAIARGSHISGVRLWEGSVVDRYADARDMPVTSKDTESDTGELRVKEG